MTNQGEQGTQAHRILLVDDNESNRKLLATKLRAKDYQVDEAEDGPSALRYLTKEQANLVVLDVLMPGMDGLQVLRAIRERFDPEQLPVIMATAQDGSDDMVRAFDLGANDYVTKPLDLPVALARIQAQLRPRAASPKSPSIQTNKTQDGLHLGSVLEEKYLLESLIGGGQHGVVYRAKHLMLDRFVALKVLHTSIQERDDLVLRFQREGISACRIQHPNAVSVLDFSVTKSGTPFLVMELLQGHTLAKEMRDHERFPIRRAAEIALPICSVLAQAHSLGIIHRDIKPQNIFLHERLGDELLKVLDFGIAKLIDDSNLSQTLTRDNVLGTPAYMAPERFSKEPYDGRADIYSLGVMLYEMLGGEHPFAPLDNDTLKLVMRHLQDTPEDLGKHNPELPRELVTLVHRALIKDFRHRPSAEEFAAELSAISGVANPELPRDEAPDLSRDLAP